MSVQKKNMVSTANLSHNGSNGNKAAATGNRLLLGGKKATGSSTDSAVVSEMRANRLAKTASDTTIAYPKTREPFFSLKDKGIPTDLEDRKERAKIREWCRTYYRTHGLMSTCIDIYARFPVQGMSLSCKDPELTKFYEQLFFDNLDYENALIDYGQEFFQSGELNLLGSWNETLGIWDGEEVLNPDDVTARWSPFSHETEYKVAVPEYMKRMIETQSPEWEYRLLVENYPEIIDAVQGSSFTDSVNPDTQDDWASAGLEVSNIMLSRVINKTSPWDLYGTPHMMRCFRQLLMEESLNAAQDAIADRLYSPFIMAKLGLTDAGDGMPWIPDQEEIGAFRDDLNTALAADFRLMVHHFGADIKSVFGRESMPRFDQDYDRLERKMLQVWGIGEALLSGSSNGAYASSALNRELVTQLMTSYQKWIIKHYKKRAMVVAEAQEHFDYETSGGIRRPIYQEVLEVDPDTGVERIVKKPKLLIPDLKFSTMNLRDEATERQFLKTMKDSGIPISDRAFMVSSGIEFDDELDRVQIEKVDKVIAEAQLKKRTKEALEAQGLLDFGPAEFSDKPAETNGMSGQVSTDDVPSDPNDPATEDSADQAMEDISDPAPTPNVAPETNDAASTDDSEIPDEDSDDDSDGPTKLPRNQIKSRPSVSDEQRSNAPRAARLKLGPSHIGMMNHLSEEEIEEAVRERNWTNSL